MPAVQPPPPLGPTGAQPRTAVDQLAAGNCGVPWLRTQLPCAKLASGLVSLMLAAPGFAWSSPIDLHSFGLSSVGAHALSSMQAATLWNRNSSGLQNAPCEGEHVHEGHV